MSNLKYLTQDELDVVKQLQDAMNKAESEEETKKLITEITLIIERAKIRYMKEHTSSS
ncbi:hypothetical protein [Halalkalibacterium ligniniphilum]|uniref:hypothetical protein n=1 Tax=Halalkalibacterium ligniniphilum TaxID=1134413 RepID=UPI00034942A9|nr:hypothetical protein [Halalkalibacterium ligniniphilum]